MHLFVADWVTVVVLHGLNDVDQLYLGPCPVVVVLDVLMHGLWNVVMVRDPVVLRLVLLLRSLSGGVLPVVLVELMIRLVLISTQWIVVHEIFKHVLMSVLFVGSACFDEFVNRFRVEKVGWHVVFFGSFLVVV